MIGRRFAAHLALWAVGAAVLRFALVPAEVCPPVTAAQVRTSIGEAVDWFERGYRDDGRYTYGFTRDGAIESSGYNTARHAGVTMSLYQVAIELDPSAAVLADQGLQYMLDDLIDTGGGAIAWKGTTGDVPLGANSLFLAALSLRRDFTGDPVHDDLMRGVGRFLVGQQQEDGSMLAHWRPSTGAPVPGITGIFASGEASWALAMLDRLFPGEGWGESAADTLDYLNVQRDRDEGRISRLPDHWAAYTVSALRPDLIDEDRMGYGRQLAGYFGIRLRFESQRLGSGVNLLLRWYPGPPAGVGTAGEGIGALWRLAQTDDRLADLEENIEDRLVCTAGFMVERQVTGAQAQEWPNPDLTRGAWFYRGYTQMDDEQHVISALLAALPILEQREASG
ncbi:hypothetical protein HQ535_03570 [bacterium]|nr:hypothetical protein [bacterium]